MNNNLKVGEKGEEVGSGAQPALSTLEMLAMLTVRIDNIETHLESLAIKEKLLEDEAKAKEVKVAVPEDFKPILDKLAEVSESLKSLSSSRETVIAFTHIQTAISLLYSRFAKNE